VKVHTNFNWVCFIIYRDFKVTAMNEEELRKSVRRQKFEKSGLQLTTPSGNGSSHTASTGTGTGTSDTEDEGSTPSAENAERSLASTLGGSTENLPQSSNSFLHAALPEGPGGLLLERGTNSKWKPVYFFINKIIQMGIPFFICRSPQHQCQAQHWEWQGWRLCPAHHHQVIHEHQEGGAAAGHQQG